MGREAQFLLGALGLLTGAFVGLLAVKLFLPRPPAGAGPDIQLNVAATPQALVEPPALAARDGVPTSPDTRASANDPDGGSAGPWDWQDTAGSLFGGRFAPPDFAACPPLVMDPVSPRSSFPPIADTGVSQPDRFTERSLDRGDTASPVRADPFVVRAAWDAPGDKPPAAVAGDAAPDVARGGTPDVLAGRDDTVAAPFPSRTTDVIAAAPFENAATSPQPAPTVWPTTSLSSPASPRSPPIVPPTAAAPLEPGPYVAQPGDSWWSVAERAYGDGRLYRALFAWNRALDARVSLVPGTPLDVPSADRLLTAWPQLTPR